MRRYIATYTTSHITVADLGSRRSERDIRDQRLYAAATKTTYAYGAGISRLQLTAGIDSPAIRRAAHRLLNLPRLTG